MKFTVDLSLAPGDRWSIDEKASSGAEELLGYYLNDMGMDEQYLLEFAGEMAAVIPQEYRDELTGLVNQTQLSIEQLMAFNLYYDLTKLMFGCTAFAVQCRQGILHGRNLDWFSVDRALARHTQYTEFINGPKGSFSTVGWPAGVGVLSGMAGGRFSITLNAVLSDDPGPTDGQSVAFLIRQVLQYAEDFTQAVDRLSEQNLLCDCLLMVCGTQPGEAVVIERTPTRCAHRWMNDGILAVTNNYQLLKSEDQSAGVDNDLIATSCGRYERICQLMNKRLPRNPAECFQYLADELVMMKITEQQMVFNAAVDTAEWVSVL